MKFILIIACLFALIIGYQKVAKKREHDVAVAIDGTDTSSPAAAAAPLFASGDPCAAKKYCLTVYLNADEGRSEGAVAAIKKLSETWYLPASPDMDRSLRAIVGGGSPSDRKKLVAALGPFAAAHNGQALAWLPPGKLRAPAWFFLEGEDKVLKSSQGFLPNPTDPDTSIRVELEIP